MPGAASMQVMAAVGGGVAAISWTFVGSCQSTGNSLNFSSLSAGAIQANDVAVFIDYCVGGLVPTAVTPSGFTNVINVNDLVFESGGRAMASWKKLAGSETSITGMNAASDSKIGLVFRPSRDFTTLTISTPQGGLYSPNPPAITVDPSGETIPVALIGIGAAEEGPVTFSTASPAFDAETVTSDDLLRVGYKTYASSPSSHSIDTDDIGSLNWLAGFYFKAE